MLFNVDHNKPVQEVMLSRRNKVQVYPAIYLNNIVERTSYQKYLGILLDEKLNFKKHIDSAIPKTYKGIFVTKKLRHSLSQKSLLAI